MFNALFSVHLFLPSRKIKMFPSRALRPSVANDEKLKRISTASKEGDYPKNMIYD